MNNRWSQNIKKLDEHERLRAKVTIVLSLSLVLFSFAGPLVRHSIQSLSAEAIFQQFGSFLLFLATSVVCYVKPKSLVPRYMLISAVFLYVVPAGLNNRGIEAPIIPVLVLLPFLGGFLIGARSALFFGSVSLSTVFSFFFLFKYGLISQTARLSADRVQGATFVSLLVVVAMSIIVSYLYESSRKASFDQLRNFSSRRSSFLAAISHEIRTPLSAIMGSIELLKSASDVDEIKDLVRVISRSKGHLSSVIDDFLDFLKINEKGLTLNMTEFNLYESIVKCIKLHAANAAAKGLMLNYTLDFQGGLFVSSDEYRISQVLNNIISNAVKYTKAGSVDVSVGLDGAYNLSFSVKDTGVGMGKDEVGKIFDPYLRVGEKSTLEIKGTGLGMSIAKDIIEHMNGSIHVESHPGKGSLFKVVIPVNSSSKVEEENIEKSTGSIAGLKILLVEDNVFLQKTTKKILEKSEGIVDIAENGLKAIEALSANSYDVVLMDINMPELNGSDAVKILRGDQYRYGGLIFALTANQVSDHIDEYMEQGFDDVLAKPIKISRLCEVYQSCLDKGALLAKPRSKAS